MNALTRKILRTYASGMGMPYRELAAHYTKLDQVGKGRFLLAAKRLEDAWQEELKARALPGWWARFMARVRVRVKAWRLA